MPIQILNILRKLKTNELITLIFSALALLLALVTMYFQFFYSDYDVKASMFSIEISKEKIVFDLALINTGNQQALVLKIAPIFHLPPSKLVNKTISSADIPTGIAYDGDSFQFSHITTKYVPIVLKPGDIYLESIELNYSLSDIEKYGLIDPSPFSIGLREANFFDFDLRFETVNSNGKQTIQNSTNLGSSD